MLKKVIDKTLIKDTLKYLDKMLIIKIIVFDILFLLSVALFERIVFSLIKVDSEFFKFYFVDFSFGQIIFLIFSLTISIAIISVFKLMILHVINKSKISLKGYSRFFWFNISAVLTILIVIFLAQILLSYLFQPEFVSKVIGILFLLLLFFFVSYWNLGHSLFIKKEKNLISKTLCFTFKRIHHYIEVWAHSLFLVLLFLILVKIISLLFTDYYVHYMQLSFIVMLFFFYALILFNRIYFHMIVHKKGDAK